MLRSHGAGGEFLRFRLAQRHLYAVDMKGNGRESAWYNKRMYDGCVAFASSSLIEGYVHESSFSGASSLASESIGHDGTAHCVRVSN